MLEIRCTKQHHRKSGNLQSRTKARSPLIEIKEPLVLMHVEGPNKPSSIVPLDYHRISPQDQSAADQTPDTVRRRIENTISSMN